MTGIHNMHHAARKGFTIIELMVTVGLFMIIIAIAVGAFTNALRTQRQVSSLISAESNVSLAVEQIAREVRTGYLFCHAPGANAQPLPACGCQNAGGVWTCSSLIFYDAQGNHMEYTLPTAGLAAGALATLNPDNASAQPQAITGNTVRVNYLTFRLFGQQEGDNWTPRVTIAMGVVPSSTDVAVNADIFSLQTTISARQIDCSVDASSTVSC